MLLRRTFLAAASGSAAAFANLYAGAWGEAKMTVGDDGLIHGETLFDDEIFTQPGADSDLAHFGSAVFRYYIDELTLLP